MWVQVRAGSHVGQQGGEKGSRISVPSPGDIVAAVGGPLLRHPCLPALVGE